MRRLALVLFGGGVIAACTARTIDTMAGGEVSSRSAVLASINAWPAKSQEAARFMIGRGTVLLVDASILRHSQELGDLRSTRADYTIGAADADGLVRSSQAKISANTTPYAMPTTS